MADLFIHNIGLLASPLSRDRDRVERELHEIPDAAILIREGAIAAAGPEREIAGEVSDDVPRLDARGRLALPGLIDCHTHPVFVGNRAEEFHMRNAGKSYQEIAEAGGGIQATSRWIRDASIEQIITESLPRFRRSLRAGVTTLEGKSGYGLDWPGEEKLLRTLQEIDTLIPQRLERTFLIHALPESCKSKREVFCAGVVREMIPRVAEEKLASAVDVFCETGAFTVDESRAFLTAAKNHGLQMTVHANQFGHSGGALLASELGARSADHLEFLSESEIDALRDAGTIGVILPGCVFFLGTIPYPPARTMIERGMRIAIATDLNPGTAMTESLPFCLTAGAIHCKLNPAELLWSATLDAARVLGLDSSIGSIEAGKRADLSLWDLPNAMSLSYYFGSTEASGVVIGGDVVFDEDDESRQY